ncbi:MAG: hypothetical protein WHV44_13660 [Anaerolineales bacterium]
MNTCFNCDRSENVTPLLVLTFQGRAMHICPQCLPALIHKPQVIAAKLPGMRLEDSAPLPHED